MKTRLLWIAIMAIGLTALYCGIFRPHVTTLPKAITDPMADLKPPMPSVPDLPLLPVPVIPALEPPPLQPLPIIEPVLLRPSATKNLTLEAKK